MFQNQTSGAVELLTSISRPGNPIIKDISLASFPPDEIKDLATWISEFNFSKSMRNITRDFSDAVFMAELISFHEPKIVELHNYPSTCSSLAKKLNWDTLNRKVLGKLGMPLADEVIDSIVHMRKGAIERVILEFRKIIMETRRMAEIALLENETERKAGESEWAEGCLFDHDGGILPDCVLINETKYMRFDLLEEKVKIARELDDTNKMLTYKVERLEITVSLKEESINELTRQIRELRELMEKRNFKGDLKEF